MLTPLVYDTETTGLSRHRGDRMFAFSTCDWNGRATTQRVDGSAARRRRGRGAVERIWSGRRDVIMHNARFDIGMTEAFLGRGTRRAMLRGGNRVHETMALSHIFRNDHPSHALGDLGWELFHYPRDLDADLHRYLSSERGLQDAPEHELVPYQIADAERTMLLFRLLYPKLAEEGFEEIYDVERRLIWTVLALEDRGVMIDRRACAEMRDWCARESDRARDEVQVIAGDRINPASDKDVGFLLYKQLGLPVVKRTKKTKQPSTDAETLKALQAKTKHPVFDALLRYSAYSRGASVLQGYLDLADDDGMIHPNIHPYQARTSRTSCTRPNLQNVSKSTTLRAAYPIPMRCVFRPRPGFVNVHVDYSGIQARQLVDASGDEEMLRIILEGDGDVHSAAALCFYGERFRLAAGRARKSLRDAAKNCVYAIGFGAGLPKVASCLMISQAEAAPGLAEFRRRFPKYSTLNKRRSSLVRRHGYVETAFGRRLRVSRSKPYAGVNYEIQGDEAGVVKRAANRIDDYLDDATSGEAGIILLIHDEIVFEWPRTRLRDLKAALRDMRELMIDFPEFKVPMEVEAKLSTRNWEEAKKYDFAA